MMTMQHLKAPSLEQPHIKRLEGELKCWKIRKRLNLNLTESPMRMLWMNVHMGFKIFCLYKGSHMGFNILTGVCSMPRQCILGSLFHRGSCYFYHKSEKNVF